MQNVKFIAIPIVKLSTENLIHIRQISAVTQESFIFVGKNLQNYLLAAKKDI